MSGLTPFFELLMSQNSLAHYLGVTDQSVHRWEKSKTDIPASSDRLIRLLYQEAVLKKNESISISLKRIANLEEQISDLPLLFTVTSDGWKAVA